MTEKFAPLRVAHVVWGYLGGGVDSVVDSYLQADDLHPNRVLSHVVIIRPSDAAGQKTPNASGGVSMVTRGSRELRVAARETAEHLCDFAPDIVLLHAFNASILGFALRQHLPSETPIVPTYHGKYYARSLIGRAKAALFDSLALRFFRKYANAIIAVSHDSATELQSGKVPAEKIIVLYNAVAIGVPPWPQRSHSDADGCRNAVKLITVSRLASQKGIDVLINAFAALVPKFPKATLEIVGDGPLRKELVDQVESLGLTKVVHFLGNRSDVAKLLSEADIFAMTSRQENHSVAVLEAMRARLPLMVSDVGGNAESVRDELDGIIIPDFDATAATAAMSKLVSSGELRARLGASARTRFEKSFESNIMIDRLINILTSLTRAP